MATPLSLCIARFAVPDAACVAQVRAAASDGRCVVVLRDAFMPRSPRTPFHWDERAAMLREALEGDGPACEFVPLRERYDDERTVDDLIALARGAGTVRVHFCGEPDPPLRQRLLERATPGWAVGPDPEGHDAAALQTTMFESTQPPAGLSVADFESLRAEHAQYAKEKREWSVAPYPVVLVTVDAVVRCADHVLLVRRGRLPGKGLLALPGGFLELKETVYESAVRELQEETQIALTAAQARALLKGVHVFDHPRRSQRGRVVTHAHYFDLGERPLPAVRGGDDAAAAEWVKIADLTALEDQLLDDHFAILAHFIGK